MPSREGTRPATPLVATFRSRTSADAVELGWIRAFVVFSACFAGLLVGGPWVAAAASAVAPLALGAVRSLRSP
jgi:hypothetical protein